MTPNRESVPVLEIVTEPTDEVRKLIDELDRILAAEYEPEQRHGLPIAVLFAPHIRFFVARLRDEIVGCARVALFEDFAEVKRMYVRPRARGRGIADILLACLEDETRAAGLDLLRLETGARLKEAMRFYERAGFRPCAIFGDYKKMPPSATALSVFMEKNVGTRP